MEYKPVAPETNSHSSGSSSSSSSSSSSRDYDYAPAVVASPVKVGGGGSNSREFGSDGESEERGFVSGEEEFEEAAGERPAAGGIGVGAADDDYGGVVDPVTAPGSFRPVAKVSNDDDDDDEDEVDDDEGGGFGEPQVKVLAGAAEGGEELGSLEGDVCASGDFGKGVERRDFGYGERGGFAEKSLRELGELLGAGGGVDGGQVGGKEVLMGVREDKAIESGDVVEESVQAGAGEVAKLQSDEAVAEQALDTSSGAKSQQPSKAVEFIYSSVASADIVDLKNIEQKDVKQIEADGVKLNDSGDMVVDATNVGLTASGAAAVGEAIDGRDSEIKAVELSSGPVTLGNGFDQISPNAEDPAETRAVRLDQSYNGLWNSINEALEQVPGTKKDDVPGVGRDEMPETGVAIVDRATAYYDEELKKDMQMEPEAESGPKHDGPATKAADYGMENTYGHVPAERNEVQSLSLDSVTGNAEPKLDDKVKPLENNATIAQVKGLGVETGVPVQSLSYDQDVSVEPGDDDNIQVDEGTDMEGSDSDGEKGSMLFESSQAAKQFLEELERGAGSQSGAESSHDHSQRIDGQIVTDSDEEVDTDEDGDGKEMFDSAALAALLKAATGADTDGGSITITSQDGSRLFSVERPAGLGSSLRSVKPVSRPNRSSLFTSDLTPTESDNNLTEEEKKKLEKIQQLRVKFLRLVQRVGYSPEDSVAAQVLYRLALVAGRQAGQSFSLESAKKAASELELEKKDDLNFSLNILVLGKAGVGKSATVNSLLGEDKATIHAFEPATTAVKEITGTVHGVKIRVFDTPGLKSSAMEQNENRRIFSSIKKFTKKCPPDIVLYVDRLDTQTRDLNDLPLLKSITSALGPSIWRSAVVTLTHAASAPPDGPSGSPLSYDVFVAQRSHVVQQSIGQAVGDLRLMNPSLMNPVSLVENHSSCRKNRDGEKVLPNGQAWRPQLLLLCFSMKILAEASSLSKPQDPFNHRKLFGFRTRSPPLPYLLSWLLQSRSHPKLSSDQGLENGDSDVDMAYSSDSDEEDEEEEYDQLPPFKPLRKAQIAKLTKEQRKAYFEEYDYRVKLLQKKQWREELKRMREIKKKGKVSPDEYDYLGEDADPEDGSPAAVPVPLHDMVLPPSFDSDNPAYRYRFLEPTSQFIARPVLDTHGWDHDCGYDGVNLEHGLAIASRFPGAVALQITKDKKEFNIHLDSSLAAKHGDNGSTMAGFDIQNIGKQLAYIVRGDTKFKNFKKNKTAAGFSVTFLGENIATGFKVEDQIALGKRVMLVGSAGTVRSNSDAAYGANLEVRLREADFPVGQDQSSLSLSLVKWRGDLALGANLQSQISVGRSSKIAVRAGLNNKLSGQITVRTSSSEQLQIALVGILPIVTAIYKSLRPGVSEAYY
ncbi:AIG1-type G domain-containing protein [Psidium guajava]|nr:AIG1-type G domain-containing protein [Psidium guajava]